MPGLYTNTSDLVKSRQSQDLLTSHQSVLNYYAREDRKAKIGFNFLRGDQLSSKEKEAYRQRRKTPVIFNTLKTAERAIMGTFSKFKLDMKWEPLNMDDQDAATRAEALRLWQAKLCRDEYYDQELVRQAWAGKGASYQECYVEVRPGKDPEIRSNNLNPFYVHFDPESRDLIRRSDARFVDVDSFVTPEELVEAFPESKDLIQTGRGSRSDNTQSFERPDRIYTDDEAQTKDERNGKYRVVERYYRVRKSYFYAIMVDTGDIEEVEEENIKAFQKSHPDDRVEQGHREELWLAVACNEISNKHYIYNKKYQSQMVDPEDDHIMFPILEFVAESLNGDPSSFVEHEIDPQRVINSMIGNIAHSAVHAASGAKLINPNAFIDEKEAQIAAQFHSDSNRAFRVKPNHIKNNDVIGNIESSTVSPDVHNMLNYAKDFSNEVMSSTPALQGMKEGSETGVLYDKRIDQSQNQLVPLMENYKRFMERRTLLRYMYQQKYFTEEMTIQVVDQSLLAGTQYEGQKSITLNHKRPATDQFGTHIPGRVTTENAIKGIKYHLTATESTKSANYRQKVMLQLESVMKAPAVQNDPVMMSYVFIAFMEMSDLPENIKEGIRSRSSILEQYDKQKFESGELAKQQQAQQIAAQAMQEQQAQYQAQKDQMDLQMQQSEMQNEQVKNSLEAEKLAIERDKLLIQRDQLGIQAREAEFKLRELQQGLGSQSLDNELKAQEIEGADLDNDLKQLDILEKQEAIGQMRADASGFTIQDMKALEMTDRQAAIQEAHTPKRDGASQTPKG